MPWEYEQDQTVEQTSTEARWACLVSVALCSLCALVVLFGLYGLLYAIMQPGGFWEYLYR